MTRRGAVTGLGLACLLVVAGPARSAMGQWCPHEVNLDGTVDTLDLILVIEAWGSNDPAADVDDDGIVGTGDLVTLILNWGTCLGACCTSAFHCEVTSQAFCEGPLLCGEFQGTGTTCDDCPQGIGLRADQIFFDDLGNALPSEFVVLRISVPFVDPEDQLIGVHGSSETPFQVEVTGGVFLDSALPQAGDRPPTLLHLGWLAELGYDSWFTVGNWLIDIGPDWPSGSPFSDEVTVTPGTSLAGVDGQGIWLGGPAGPDAVGWSVPASLRDPGGGGPTPTPQSVAGNWSDLEVLVMQLAIQPSGKPGPFQVEGSLGITVVIDGETITVPAAFVFSVGSCSP